jgi:dihydroorotate dehydrogenase electron transfer subunit
VERHLESPGGRRYDHAMPVARDAELIERQSQQGPYLVLTFRHPEAATARAGQFVMLRAGTGTEPLLPRPFSILETDPTGGLFRVFLKAVGPGTHALAALLPGETATCLGPLGRPFSPPPAEAEAVLVAGGYGIAPFLLFSRELKRAERRVRVFYGGRSAEDVQGREPFEPLGVPLVTATEDGTIGHRGRVTEPLADYLDRERVPDREKGPVHLYACGPDAMLHAVARLAHERELPAQVSLDPWMGCGIGTCLGCVVRIQRAEEEAPHPRCACTEGPVFDARDVVWPGEDSSRARRQALEIRA